MRRIIKRKQLCCQIWSAAKLVIFANAVEDRQSLYGGAFHGGEAIFIINVGVSGPGVVKRALEKFVDRAGVLAKQSENGAKITRIGQLVGQMASERLINFGIVDLNGVTPAVGDSVARVLEEMGLETAV